MISRTNEKLIHAMVFFIQKTKYCYKLKLFKLLYFFDFERFKQTGRSATGLEYFAWKMGPAPVKLYEKIKDQTDLKKFFNFIPESFLDPDSKKDKAVRIAAKIKFKPGLFSQREIGIMHRLADLYKNAKAKDMTDISHDKKGPWHKVFKEENSPNKIIPYKYILDDSPQSVSLEEADEIEKESMEMQRMFDSIDSV